MNFFEFAENLNKYTADQFLDDLQISLEKNEYVLALQRQQWNEGLDSNGNILGRFSKATEIITDGRKKAGELFDINETGETRRKLVMYGERKNNDLLFYFDSDSRALPELLERIGNRLFGLQDKNMGQFIAIAQQTAIELLNKNLKLK
jgi:hypothetical protein